MRANDKKLSEVIKTLDPKSETYDFEIETVAELYQIPDFIIAMEGGSEQAAEKIYAGCISGYFEAKRESED